MTDKKHSNVRYARIAWRLTSLAVTAALAGVLGFLAAARESAPWGRP